MYTDGTRYAGQQYKYQYYIQHQQVINRRDKGNTREYASKVIPF